MQEYGFSLTRIMVDSVLIRETSGQWKLVFRIFYVVQMSERS